MMMMMMKNTLNVTIFHLIFNFVSGR